MSVLSFDTTPAASAAAMRAIVQMATTREPVNRFVLVIAPDAAYLARRLDIVAEYRSLALYDLAKRLDERPPRDDLSLLVLGDDEPKLSTIPMGPLRAAVKRRNRTR